MGQFLQNLIALLMALFSLAPEAQDARQISTSGQVRCYYLAGSTTESPYFRNHESDILDSTVHAFLHL